MGTGGIGELAVDADGPTWDALGAITGVAGAVCAGEADSVVGGCGGNVALGGFPGESSTTAGVRDVSWGVVVCATASDVNDRQAVKVEIARIE